MKVVKISRYLYSVERDGVLITQFRGDKAGRKAHAYVKEHANKLTRADWHEVLMNKSSIPAKRDCKPRLSAGSVSNVNDYKKPKIKTYNAPWAWKKRAENLTRDQKAPTPYTRDSFTPEYYNSPKPWRRGGKVTGIVK